MLNDRDRDPVHLQLILKEVAEQECGDSGSGCSDVVPPLPVDFTLLHGDKRETEGNKDAKKLK